jgi:alanyl-tRNA synthetase
MYAFYYLRNFTMQNQEIRQKFIDFFKGKNHKILPSSSLIIHDDPSVLFVSAGMQQFKPYFMGREKPPARRICTVQKCFRTSDIEEVGDTYHLTFFEMLGNFSFGDYSKRQATGWAWQFVNKVLKIDQQKVVITVFAGDKDTPADTESVKIWRDLGIRPEKIIKLGRKDNFWGPTGQEGPCGPNSEIYIDRGKNIGCGKASCGPACDCDRFLEIWNLVFMEYYQDKKGQLSFLPQKNVDTGMGLERISAVLQGKISVYKTDIFTPIMNHLEKLIKTGELSTQKGRYGNFFWEVPYPKDLSKKGPKFIKTYSRTIADHIRSIVFLISEGISPSNKEQGYVLRRMIRRAIVFGKLLNIQDNFLSDLALRVINQMSGIYPELKKKGITKVIEQEEQNFTKTLRQGLRKFRKIVKKSKKIISGQDAFYLYDTYGFPLEILLELAQERGLKVDKNGFNKELKQQKERSRKYQDFGMKKLRPEMAKNHTATHLLHQALRDILGPHVKQAGSDLKPERLRFDFTHPKPLMREEIKKVEKIVNQKIKEKLRVKSEIMDYNEAIEKGAIALFTDKYGDKVQVVSIGDYSREFCGGPHVRETSELGYFKIIKEQSSSSGVRRIKAITR